MVSLEAAVAGANVVGSVFGSLRDYMGDRAWYCHPADQDEITAAVEAAYRAPRMGRGFGERFVDATRARGAAGLAAAYRMALSRPAREVRDVGLLRSLADAERTSARRLRMLVAERLAAAARIGELESALVLERAVSTTPQPVD
jgi:hypothetical protein